MLHSACLLAILVTAGPGEDQIHLKDGKVVAGTVTARLKDAVEIEVDGKKRRIQRGLIDRITDAAGHIRWVDAQTAKSAHYELVSNLPRPRAQELLRQLELFYAWFHGAFAKDWRLHDLERLRVQCARTRAEYIEHLAKGSTIQPPPQAFFSTGDETLCLCDEPLPGHARAEQTLFHEAGHQLLTLAANFPPGTQDPHYWVFEALPCTFEGLVEKGGKLVQLVEKGRSANMKARLKAGKPMKSLAELDAMTQQGFGVAEYDQGYTLAWFLLTAEGGKHRKGFLAFVQDVAFTRVRPDTFQKLLGRPIDAFEPAWREFVLGLELGK